MDVDSHRLHGMREEHERGKHTERAIHAPVPVNRLMGWRTREKRIDEQRGNFIVVSCKYLARKETATDYEDVM